ncbi:MAG: hypothetical protein ABDH29_07150 [Aquificaceae bacterium]
MEKELKEKKLSKEDIGKVQFRRLCKDYARRFVKVQKEEFLRLVCLRTGKTLM